MYIYITVTLGFSSEKYIILQNVLVFVFSYFISQRAYGIIYGVLKEYLNANNYAQTTISERAEDTDHTYGNIGAVNTDMTDGQDPDFTYGNVDTSGMYGNDDSGTSGNVDGSGTYGNVDSSDNVAINGQPRSGAVATEQVYENMAFERQ